MPLFTFTNNTAITIADNTTTSSNITTSSVVGKLITARVTLNGITHTFSGDLDFLLIDNDNEAFAFLTDTGSGSDFSADNITIADSGTTILPTTANLPSGTFLPSSFESAETSANWAGAPIVNVQHAPPVDEESFNEVFGGDSSNNGVWQLWLKDDAGGDTGTIAGGWTLELITDTVANNFNGDTRSDLLWRQDAGTFTTWQFNSGSTVTQNVQTGFVPTNFVVDAIGDFNADGRSDLLWRDTNTGFLTTWQTDAGGTSSTQNVFTANVPTNFRIDAVGDWNGDGRDDLVWRDNAGFFTTWQFNAGGNTTTQNVFTANVPNDWHIVAVGDWNGDGRDDLAWRQEQGLLTTWQMDGASVNQNVLEVDVDLDQHVIGSGDFNGDGRTDLLWRDDFGVISTWLMDGKTPTIGAYESPIQLEWEVEQIGDFNGDGRDDLLFRNTNNGDVRTWQFNEGGTSVVQNVFSSNVPLDWHLQTNNYDFV